MVMLKLKNFRRSYEGVVSPKGMPEANTIQSGNSLLE